MPYDLQRFPLSLDFVPNAGEGLFKILVGGFFSLIDNCHLLLRYGGLDALHTFDKADILLDFVFTVGTMHLRSGGDDQRVCFLLLRIGRP